jgi:uncharacterized protein
MATSLGLWQWALLALGALLIGLSKTGIVGIGIFAVAIFALVLPARESVGVVLLILISADVVAVTAYRRHAVWPYLFRLFPWAGAGVVVGYFALGRVDDTQMEWLVGAILLVLVLLQGWRQWVQSRRAGADLPVPDGRWFVAGTGILAGFTTMVANAAGPIMTLYLLAMRLPKLAFIGTAAWYFMLVNLFKVPFSISLGLIDMSAVLLALRLVPFAAIGALAGRAIIRYIDQRLFESLALIFTFLAALRLLL